MNDGTTKETMFQEIALAHFQGREVTIDEMEETCIAEGFWSPDEDAALLRKGRRSELRRFARKPIYDEDGNRREMVNIQRPKAARDQNQQFFAFLDETTQEDLEWLIRDRVRRVHDWQSEVKRLLDVMQQRFGEEARRQVQARLNLDFEG
jgi:hypothetical protein